MFCRCHLGDWEGRYWYAPQREIHVEYSGEKMGGSNWYGGLIRDDYHSFFDRFVVEDHWVEDMYPPESTPSPLADWLCTSLQLRSILT
jgi:hypothetical protein